MFISSTWDSKAQGRNGFQNELSLTSHICCHTTSVPVFLPLPCSKVSNFPWYSFFSGYKLISLKEDCQQVKGVSLLLVIILQFKQKVLFTFPAVYKSCPVVVFSSCWLIVPGCSLFSQCKIGIIKLRIIDPSLIIDSGEAGQRYTPHHPTCDLSSLGEILH